MLADPPIASPPALPSTSQDPAPRRQEQRRPTSWTGLIRLSGGEEVPCVIRDVSRSGARLCVPSALSVTKTFLLKIEERGFAFRVAVMWRNGDHVGVRIEKIVKLKAVLGQDAES